MNRGNLLTAIESASRRRWPIVFIVTALLVVGSLWLSQGLVLETDFLKMLPTDDPTIGGFVETITDFGSLDFLLVMVEVPPERPIEDLYETLDTFAAELEPLDAIDYVEYRLDAESPIFRTVRDNATLFLDGEGLERLRISLTDEAIRERVATIPDAIRNPLSFVTRDLLIADPLGLTPIFYRRTLATRGSLKLDLASGYYLSDDGRAALMVVKPSSPPTDLPFARELDVDVRAAFDRATEGLDPAPRLALGGSYIIAIEDAGLIQADMSRNAIVSFLAVIALYLFCYRSVAAVVFSTAPLVVGQVLTLAVAILVFGGLNNTTVAFTAMLMGLGTDFTIVMYGRYVEERRAGASLAEAMRKMMGETGLGVFTGAITSAGTFGAVCVSRFPGLVEFGFLVAGGILLCMVAILFLLPAMIAFHERNKQQAAEQHRRFYLHSFGIERLMVAATRRPRTTLAICTVLTAAALFGAWGIELSDSYQDLRSESNRGHRVQQEIGERFGGQFKPMMAVSSGETVEQALAADRRVLERLDRWVERGALAGYESLATLVPAPEAQSAAIARLGEDDFSPARVRATTEQAMRAAGLNPAPFREALATLEQQLTPTAPLAVADLRDGALAPLIDRHLTEQDGVVRVATFVFPADASWKGWVPQEFLDDVGADGTLVTGVNVMSMRLKQLFRTDAQRAMALGLLMVTILLAVDFRNLKMTLFGLAQLVVGIVWMMGLMRAMDIQMNFVNAFATTMILGVGIDYGIHLIHRIVEQPTVDSAGSLETGKAVVMAALTNVAGFGTIALSNFPGIRSVGLVCLFGTLCCLLTSLTLLPALMVLLPVRKR